MAEAQFGLVAYSEMPLVDHLASFWSRLERLVWLELEGVEWEHLLWAPNRQALMAYDANVDTT